MVDHNVHCCCGDYIIGSIPYQDWRCLSVTSNLVLSYSEGLAITHRVSAVKSVWIIGEIYDPLHLSKTKKLIAQEILTCSGIAYCENYAGCYVVIQNLGDQCVLLTDAASMFKVFYTTGAGDQYNIASTEQLLAESNNFQADTAITDQLEESSVIGASAYLPLSCTEYPQIFCLLPNHTLAIPQYQVERYFPHVRKKTIAPQVAISQSAVILKGAAQAVLNRYGAVKVALTAGIDSRLSLAAFAACDKTKVEAFTFHYPYLEVDHPDIAQAKVISAKLGIKHTVIKVVDSFSAEKEFCKYYGKNAILINSNIADIFRCYYRLPNWAASVWLFFRLEKIPRTQRIRIILGQWLAEAQAVSKEYGYELYDLFYWENRIAKWAVNGFTGKNNGVTKICIFNCHMLIHIMLQVDSCRRSHRQFNRELVNLLSPGLENIPINPPVGFVAYLKQLYKYLPLTLQKIVKYVAAVL